MTCREPVVRSGHTQPCGGPIEQDGLCRVHLRRRDELAKRRPRSTKIGHAANLT